MPRTITAAIRAINAPTPASDVFTPIGGHLPSGPAVQLDRTPNAPPSNLHQIHAALWRRSLARFRTVDSAAITVCFEAGTRLMSGMGGKQTLASLAFLP